MNIFKNFKYFRKKNDIVFFSEGKYQWKFFKDFIHDILKKSEKNILFLASDSDDYAFNIENKKFKTLYVGKGFFRLMSLNIINSKFLFTSTPDLGTKAFRKSPFVEKYVYIPHSVGSTHLTYKERAFDNFDVIFCVGQDHQNETRIREEKFNLKKKKLIPFGYPSLKSIREAQKNYIDKNIDKNVCRILYAPSWGKDSSLEFLDLNFINMLLEKKFLVYFKPHPMSYKNNTKTIKKIETNFSKNKSFHTIKSEDFSYFFNSDLLITDWSGISFEFFFIKKHPKIIFLDTPIRAINKNYKMLEINTIDEKYRAEMGLITKPNIQSIKSNIEIVLGKENSKNFKNQELERKILFDYDKSLNNSLDLLS